MREKLGFSRQKVSEMLDINEETFARYERGESEPRASQIRDIAELFGVTVDEILYGHKERKISVDLVIATMAKEGDAIMKMRTDGLSVVVTPEIGLMGVSGMAPIREFGELRGLLVGVCKHLILGFDSLVKNGTATARESKELEVEMAEIMESALDEIKATQKHDAVGQGIVPVEKKSFAQRQRDAESNNKGR